jgi:transcriptional regulator with XRE-family HTH domain
MRTGNEIRQLRKKLRLSQEGLANIIGVSRSAVYDWEREAYSPEGENLVNLAKALEVSVAYLIGETDDPTPADKTALKEQPVIKSNVHFETEEPISIDQIVIPVLSPEQTACCGNGIPLSEITSDNDEKILVPRKEVGRLCDGKMPFAIIADGESMKKWGIRSGSRVVINPVEELHDFDIALVCYKDNLVLKKLRRMRDGSIDLISADGSIITVPADDACVPDLFAIWGKAMTYTYKESGKVKHGL